MVDYEYAKNEVLEYLKKYPLINSSILSNNLDIYYATAQSILDKMAIEGVLKRIDIKQNKYWCKIYMDIELYRIWEEKNNEGIKLK